MMKGAQENTGHQRITFSSEGCGRFAFFLILENLKLEVGQLLVI